MIEWSSYPLSLGKLHKSVALVHPGQGWMQEWKRLKLLFRGLFYGRWNVRWQEYLNTPYMIPYAQVLPQLYLKVQLPYLNRRYSTARRMEMLVHHYDFLRDGVSPKLLHRMLVDAPVCLARWETSTGDFSLQLDFPRRFWQEGELELALYNEPTARLVAFVHFTISGPGEMSIGCLQGGKPITDPNQLSHQKLGSAFRRDMHGLRHKNFLIFAVRHLAQVWGITSVRAVSAEVQIWAEKILADYNSFWMEEGGVLAQDGMFNLPLLTSSKGPRTRSLYQRRDQCLEVIGREMEANLAEPWRSLDTLDISGRKEAPEAADSTAP